MAVQIGPNSLTGNLSVCGLFHGYYAFGGDLFPLIHSLWSNADSLGENSSTAAHIGGFFNYIEHFLNTMKATLTNSIVSSAYGYNRKQIFHNLLMQTELWQRIRIARKGAKLSQQALADKVGVERPAVTQWESENPGNRTKPKIEMLPKIARATGTSETWLITGTDSTGQDTSVPTIEVATLKAPVVNGASAAEVPLKATDYWPVRPQWNDKIESVAFFVAEDDSMYSPVVRKSFKPGDVALIEIGAVPNPGDVVLCHLSGENQAMLRVFKARGNGAFELSPYNEAWAPVPVSEPGKCRIIGVMREAHIY